VSNTWNYEKKTSMVKTNVSEEIKPQTMRYISIFEGNFNYRLLDIDMKLKI
jgi:hypothetical protein